MIGKQKEESVGVMDILICQLPVKPLGLLNPLSILTVSRTAVLKQTGATRTFIFIYSDTSSNAYSKDVLGSSFKRFYEC